MKLEAKAKPIKFNIEYKCFDEIKKAFNETDNFSYEKIYEMFKDERLFRWLRQGGEEANAQKVKERYQLLIPNKNNIIDRIVFLSLFSDKIEKFVQKNKMQIDKMLLADLLCNEDYALIKEMYRLTKENNKEEWATLIKRNIKENNIEEYFNDEDFFCLLDSTDWGEMFAAQKSFEPNRQLLVEKALHKKGVYIDILGVFVDKTRKDWEDYLKHEQELDRLIELYSIPVIKLTDFDWPRLFANATNNPENDIRRVKSVLIEEPEKLKIYGEYCVNKGIKEAKDLLETPSEKLINLFLENPSSYRQNSRNTNYFDKEQELDKFLQLLSEIYANASKEWDRISKETKSTCKYRKEAIFLKAMFKHLMGFSSQKEVSDELETIRNQYLPADCMINWISRKKRDLRCTQKIYSFTKREQFIEYVVRHLIDNKFA